VSSRDRNNDGFDVEEFLFGEGSGSSAGETDIGNVINFSHFFLGEKFEAMDIGLCEKWLEIVI